MNKIWSSILTMMTKAHGQIMSGMIWAFEIYDTETGETVIHSEE